MRTKKELLYAAEIMLDAINGGGDRMNGTMEVVKSNLLWMLEIKEE